jgi:hypothetical protein
MPPFQCLPERNFIAEANMAACRVAKNIIATPWNSPRRIAFGIGHAFSCAGLSALPMYLKLLHQLPSLPMGWIGAATLVCAAAKGMHRNAHILYRRHNDFLRAIDAEFAHFASSAAAQGIHPETRALGAGLLNGIRASGLRVLISSSLQMGVLGANLVIAGTQWGRDNFRDRFLGLNAETEEWYERRWLLQSTERKRVVVEREISEKIWLQIQPPAIETKSPEQIADELIADDITNGNRLAFGVASSVAYGATTLLPTVLCASHALPYLPVKLFSLAAMSCAVVGIYMRNASSPRAGGFYDLPAIQTEYALSAAAQPGYAHQSITRASASGALNGIKNSGSASAIGFFSFIAGVAGAPITAAYHTLHKSWQIHKTKIPGGAKMRHIETYRDRLEIEFFRLDRLLNRSGLVTPTSRTLEMVRSEIVRMINRPPRRIAHATWRAPNARIS